MSSGTAGIQAKLVETAGDIMRRHCELFRLFSLWSEESSLLKDVFAIQQLPGTKLPGLLKILLKTLHFPGEIADIGLNEAWIKAII